MELKDTIEMMNSEEPEERFKAEYFQLVLRYFKLNAMLKLWDEGKLEYTPTCPRSTYNMQISAMTQYMAVLEARAAMEGFDLTDGSLIYDKMFSEHPDVFGDMGEAEKEKLRKVGDAFQTIFELAWGKPDKGE